MASLFRAIYSGLFTTGVLPFHDPYNQRANLGVCSAALRHSPGATVAVRGLCIVSAARCASALFPRAAVTRKAADIGIDSDTGGDRRLKTGPAATAPVETRLLKLSPAPAPQLRPLSPAP